MHVQTLREGGLPFRQRPFGENILLLLIRAQQRHLSPVSRRAKRRVESLEHGRDPCAPHQHKNLLHAKDVLAPRSSLGLELDIWRDVFEVTVGSDGQFGKVLRLLI